MRQTRRQMITGLLALTGGGALSGCAVTAVLQLPEPARPGLLRVASFNIGYLDLTAAGQSGLRGLPAWERRREVVAATLAAMAPDLVAFQEMESWTGAPQAGPPVQRRFLAARLPGYGVAAATCLDGRESGQPIFYRRARFAPVDACALPLGAAAGLAGAFAGYGDLVTYAVLRDRVAGRRLTVLNLHLHFTDRLRQVSGADLALRLAQEAMARGDRVIVLGDMNSLARSGPMRALTAGGLTLVPSQGASFHFNAGLNAFAAIDHILHGPGFLAGAPARILRARAGTVWPSDHYPIYADLVPV